MCVMTVLLYDSACSTNYKQKHTETHGGACAHMHLHSNTRIAFERTCFL